MNCLDYRRALLSGGSESDVMREHRLHCVSCSETHKEHLAFEDEVRRALEVPVPADLEGRLAESVRQLGRTKPTARMDRRRFLAAASVAAVAAGAGFYLWRGRDDPMAMASIEFVMKEEAKSIMMGSMPREEAARMLADSLPLERIERIGQIRHIAPCPFGGGTAYNVILMVPQDKVSLLVMPDTTVAARGRASYDGMYASVVPLRKGSVGIVGANAAVVESVVGAILA